MRALAADPRPLAPPRAAPPVAAARPGGTRVEICGLDELGADPEGWDDLVRAAAAPTPFFSRAVLEAHAASGFAKGIRVLAVRRGTRILALLPFRPGGASFGLLGRVHAAWTSPYTTACTPLVAADAADEAVVALLDGLARVPGRTWLLPSLQLDGPVGRALRAEIEARSWPSLVLRPFGRAVLDGAAGPVALAGARAKDMRRRRRRLEELGTLRLESATEGAALAAGVDSFLRLEEAGWKGRRGSAMNCRPETVALARSLFGTSSGPVRGRADLLTLDGRPIAANLSLLCGGTLFGLKTTFDEALRRMSPGLLLEEETIRILAETGFAERLDSAAVAGSHMDALYPDRERIGDLVLVADRRGSLAGLGRRAARDAWRRALRTRLVSAYRSLRGA